jgi:hypothetical protein
MPVMVLCILTLVLILGIVIIQFLKANVFHRSIWCLLLWLPSCATVPRHTGARLSVLLEIIISGFMASDYWVIALEKHPHG